MPTIPVGFILGYRMTNTNKTQDKFSFKPSPFLPSGLNDRDYVNTQILAFILKADAHLFIRRIKNGEVNYAATATMPNGTQMYWFNLPLINKLLEQRGMPAITRNQMLEARQAFVDKKRNSKKGRPSIVKENNKDNSIQNKTKRKESTRAKLKMYLANQAKEQKQEQELMLAPEPEQQPEPEPQLTVSVDTETPQVQEIEKPKPIRNMVYKPDYLFSIDPNALAAYAKDIISGTILSNGATACFSKLYCGGNFKLMFLIRTLNDRRYHILIELYLAQSKLALVCKDIMLDTHVISSSKAFRHVVGAVSTEYLTEIFNSFKDLLDCNKYSKLKNYQHLQ